MKKTYLNPELLVVKIKVNHQLLTISAGGETNNENDLLGRDSDWDEDEY